MNREDAQQFRYMTCLAAKLYQSVYKADSTVYLICLLFVFRFTSDFFASGVACTSLLYS